MNVHELRCTITVLTGFKLGIHHLIAAGFAKVEQSEEFKASGTESRLSKIHLELDHYINALESALYRHEHGDEETLETIRNKKDF
jgi:hypothetical protein